jgi:hypothetical protein
MEKDAAWCDANNLEYITRDEDTPLDYWITILRQTGQAVYSFIKCSAFTSIFKKYIPGVRWPT